MSDLHSKQGWSSKVTDRQETELRRQESDADKETSSSVYHQHESQVKPCHGVRHWHAANWLPDCRLGFPECKLGSSCCRPGWKTALEEPLCHSKSLAMPFKRHESVTMLPSLLSNLAVSRTRSDPCIFGKDFLRITLPLPGEPKDCEAKGHSVEESELSTFGNMVSCEPMNLAGLETPKDSSAIVFKASTSPLSLVCEKTLPVTGMGSSNDTMFMVQNSGPCLQAVYESSYGIAGLNADDCMEYSVQNSGISFNDAMENPHTFCNNLSEKAPQEVNAGFGVVRQQFVGFQKEPDLGLQSVWKSSKEFKEFDGKSSSFHGSSYEEKQSWNVGGTSLHENAAADSLIEGVNNSSRLLALRTPQWDDCWSSQPNEKDRYSGQRSVKYRDKSRDQTPAPAMVTKMDQAEEEGSDEVYLVLTEHEDQQSGRIEDGGDDRDFYDNDDEGNCKEFFDAKHYMDDDHAEAGLLKDEDIGLDNSSSAYKEDDDIWSDEHFVSSQVKGFPPPISILANETHPGLPGHMPRTLWRSVKRDGRFVLQEVQARPREFFRATREYGRLRLQLVRPDSDPVGTYSETVDMLVPEGFCAASEDKEVPSEAVSSGYSESIGNSAGTYQPEEHGIEHRSSQLGAGYSSECVESSTQRLDTSLPEDCCTAQTDEVARAGPDQNGTKVVRGQVPSTSLPEEHGNVLKAKTSGQYGREVFGERTSLDAVLQEIPDQIDADVMIEVSCVTKHNSMSHTLEDMLGEKMLSDEVLTQESIESKNFRLTDAGQKGFLNENGAYKIDDREKFSSFGLKDEVQVLGVEITLDSGQKQDMVQIDKDQLVERMGNVKLCIKLDAGQFQEVKELDICNHRNVVPPTVQGNEEQYIQDYQHPCFNTTYGFDNNLNVLSSSQGFMQFPIQPAVR